MRLLIVEDHPTLRENIERILQQSGFTVDATDTIAAAKHAIHLINYDAVLLDLQLPDGDGLSILDYITKRPIHTPVLIMTSRDSVEHRIHGLNAGADDYLIKPFDNEELVARVRALLRRPGNALGVILTTGNISFDSISREVFIKERLITLPGRETDILELLMRRTGNVVPKQVIEDNIYGWNDRVSSNAIEANLMPISQYTLCVALAI